MSWLFDSVDIYCERTDVGLLNEPMNAITNLAFIAAATYLYLLYRDHHQRDRAAKILIVLIGIIGIGSSLFHMFANQLTMLMDVIPITLFVFYYLWTAFRRFLHWGNGQTFLLLLLFGGCTWLIGLIPAPYNLNNSAPYLPCLAAIIYLGMRMKDIRHESAETLFLAATWFSVSLFFRIIDMALCSLIFTGTHFLWHLCNSVVLCVLTKVIVEHTPLTLRNN